MIASPLREGFESLLSFALGTLRVRRGTLAIGNPGYVRVEAWIGFADRAAATAFAADPAGEHTWIELDAPGQTGVQLSHARDARVEADPVALAPDVRALIGRHVAALLRVEELTHDLAALEQTRSRLSRSETLLRAAEQIASLGSYEYDIATGEVYCSDEYYRLVGFDPATQQLSHADIRRLAHHEDRAAVQAAYDQALAEQRPFDIVYRMYHRTGRLMHLRSRGYAVNDAQGRPIRVFGTVADLTVQQRDEAERRELESRFTEAFDNGPLGMSIISAQPADFGRFTRVNRAYCELLGYAPDEVIGRDYMSFTASEDQRGPLESVAALLDGETAVMRCEVRMLRRDGTPIWVRQTRSLMRDATGQPRCFFTHVEDVTQRRADQAELEHLAYHDGLTGALNQRGLSLEIARTLLDRPSSELPTALLLLDLDHFKYVNDTMGHSAGDRILCRVAHALRVSFADGTIIARLGGDQFLIVLPNCGEADAIAAADAARREIEASIYLTEDADIRATASIGIVMVDAWTQHTIDEAIAAADAALASAKAQGRNRSVVARSLVSSNAAMRQQLTWTQRIRRALQGDSFVLYGQPILNLRNGRIERYELLLRMVDEDGTVHQPDAFLPIAERTGLMPEIDCWVVTEAVRIAATEHRAGNPVVFEVNLSGASLTNETVSETIEREIRTAELDPRALVFEITETAAIENMGQACNFAERISALGCAFALDDFGAGFSSFYYLKYLPFSDLKIDGEFIRNLTSNVSDQHIVRAIVELARGLGKSTIAEFVGDAETALLLRNYGVDFAQGYFVGEPVVWPLRTGARANRLTV